MVSYIKKSTKPVSSTIIREVSLYNKKSLGISQGFSYKELINSFISL